MGINLQFPLHAYRKGFFETNNTTIEAVREDIKVLLLTRKGERIINSSIGTNLPVFAGELFENIDKGPMKLKIKNEIESALSTWMPHVRLAGLELITDEDSKGRGLRPNDLLILMDYVLTNAEALKDSVQLTISG